MRLVFLGTPDFAVPTLEGLVKSNHEVVGVFTQPDRPAGRGKQLKPSPVKECALAHNLPVYQPEKIKSPDAVAILKELAPECIVVVAYGQILSKEILSLPPYGCINVHASLLPAYRGAAPIHWAVINGETETGITTMLMDEGLDTGDMLLKASLPIPMEATTGEIHDQLAKLGAELLLKTLEELQAGRLKPIPQTGPSSYAPLLKKEHEKINWKDKSINLYNKIRGLNPWPGAYTLLKGNVLKIHRSRLIDPADLKELSGSNRFLTNDSVQPGTVIRFENDGFVVKTGDGELLITEVQPAGKRPMRAQDFVRGKGVSIGEILN